MASTCASRVPRQFKPLRSVFRRASFAPGSIAYFSLFAVNSAVTKDWSKKARSRNVFKRAANHLSIRAHELANVEDLQVKFARRITIKERKGD